MRTGRDAECVALMRELPGGEVRVNLRSRGRVDVSGLARELGGGGHLHSAGVTISAPLEKASEVVVARLRDALRARDEAPSFPDQAASPR